MKMGEMYMNRVDHKNNYITVKNNNIYCCGNKWVFPRSTLSICFPVVSVPQTAGLLLYAVITAVIFSLFFFFLFLRTCFLNTDCILNLLKMTSNFSTVAMFIILCCVFHVACAVVYVVI